MTAPYHNTFEEPYLATLAKILKKGDTRKTRNGVTKAIFAEQLRFDLTQGFPLLTTKKVNFELILAELLWFLEGGRCPNQDRGEIYGRMSTHRLSEIYGKKASIWDGDAENFKTRDRAQFDGDCGRIYGAQWRDYSCFKESLCSGHNENGPFTKKMVVRHPKDQIEELITKLRNDPYGRYARVQAWNPAESDDMALPACHASFQCFVSQDPYDKEIKRLSLHMEQRSCDMFLGVPFNIASYALLTHMLAQVTGMVIGELVITLLDCHVYEAHIPQVETQLSRTPLTPPKLWLNPEIKAIDDFRMVDAKVENYYNHGILKALLLTKNT